MKILNCNFVFSSVFSLFWFPVMFSLWNLFFLSLFFVILSYVFYSTSLFLVSKTQVENTHFFFKKWVCNITGFFINLCFAKCEKLSFFGGAFFLQIVGCFWKHYKNRHFSTFFKARFYKKWHFWKLLPGPSWKLLSGPSWVRLKKRQLGPDNNFQSFSAQFFLQNKCAKTPIFIVFFDNRCFRKKLGPDNNFQSPQTWTR